MLMMSLPPPTCSWLASLLSRFERTISCEVSSIKSTILRVLCTSAEGIHLTSVRRNPADPILGTKGSRGVQTRRRNSVGLWIQNAKFRTRIGLCIKKESWIRTRGFSRSGCTGVEVGRRDYRSCILKIHGAVDSDVLELSFQKQALTETTLSNKLKCRTAKPLQHVNLLGAARNFR